MNKLALRKVHRWLGLFAGIQLLAWTVSGLYFTLIPIDDIHGDHLLDKPAPVGTAARDVTLLSPTDLAYRHPELAELSVSEFRLTDTLGTPVYIAAGKRVHGTTGQILPPVTEAEARLVAASRSSHTIASVELVEEVEVDSEYRGGELPAWKVTLDAENAALYVGTTTGRIRAVRTEAWRWFDFLWSLHIMDYEEREDFNHLLIQALAVLGLVTVLSGLTLFFATQRWKPRT